MPFSYESCHASQHQSWDTAGKYDDGTLTPAVTRQGLTQLKDIHRETELASWWTVVFLCLIPLWISLRDFFFSLWNVGWGGVFGSVCVGSVSGGACAAGAGGREDVGQKSPERKQTHFKNDKKVSFWFLLNGWHLLKQSSVISETHSHKILTRQPESLALLGKIRHGKVPV